MVFRTFNALSVSGEITGQKSWDAVQSSLARSSQSFQNSPRRCHISQSTAMRYQVGEASAQFLSQTLQSAPLTREPLPHSELVATPSWICFDATSAPTKTLKQATFLDKAVSAALYKADDSLHCVRISHNIAETISNKTKLGICLSHLTIISPVTQTNSPGSRSTRPSRRSLHTFPSFCPRADKLVYNYAAFISSTEYKNKWCVLNPQASNNYCCRQVLFTSFQSTIAV